MYTTKINPYILDLYGVEEVTRGNADWDDAQWELQFKNQLQMYEMILADPDLFGDD